MSQCSILVFVICFLPGSALGSSLTIIVFLNNVWKRNVPLSIICTKLHKSKTVYYDGCYDVKEKILPLITSGMRDIVASMRH